MSDFDTQSLTSNVPEYSVSELSQKLKRRIEDEFGQVRVRGEVSRVLVAASGHGYWTMKDERATLTSVCWRGTLERLATKPEEGLEMVATGRLTAYPARSQYQLVVEQLEVAGIGAFLKLLEERKQKLQAEGLFAESHKKPLPFLPKVIGVVTSLRGAVIRDILHRVQERFPLHVIVWPVLVQGDCAAQQVAAAIEGFNRLPDKAPNSETRFPPRPDVLIVARGGGSIEDLWAFNEEIVARAAFASDIPLISAIGHETDFSILDFVADIRAPTPTAAAEIATPIRSDLIRKLADLLMRMEQGLGRGLTDHRKHLDGLRLRSPLFLVGDFTQRLDEQAQGLLNRFRERLQREQQRILALRPLQPSALIAMKTEGLKNLAGRCERATRQVLTLTARVWSDWGNRLPTPERHLRLSQVNLTSLGGNLEPAGLRSVTQGNDEVRRLGSMLDALSYKGVLARGFAVIRKPGGGTISDAARVGRGPEENAFAVEMRDGSFVAQRK